MLYVVLNVWFSERKVCAVCMHAYLIFVTHDEMPVKVHHFFTPTSFIIETSLSITALHSSASFRLRTRVLVHILIARSACQVEFCEGPTRTAIDAQSIQEHHLAAAIILGIRRLRLQNVVCQRYATPLAPYTSLDIEGMCMLQIFTHTHVLHMLDTDTDTDTHTHTFNLDNTCGGFHRPPCAHLKAYRSFGPPV